MSDDVDANPPLRIAFYGYAEREAGSVSSAGHVILDELLTRGHQIDFFGKRSFAYPAALIGRAGFRFIDVGGTLERVFERLAGFRVLRPFAGALTAGQTGRNVPRGIAAAHARSPYDVCLFFGTWAFRRVRGLPMVSWVQGPPGTDTRSIARHARTIRRLEGTFRYAALRLYAAQRDFFGRPPFAESDLVICGSRWAADDLRRSLRGDAEVFTLPYPIDLQAFAPGPEADVARSRPPEILWAGRSVPRKRLDLFLDACATLIRAGRDVRVRIVGSFNFTPGYRRLVEEFAYPERLEYVPSVPRDQMVETYRRAAVLVQPSEDENFGSAVAEAMACGTPVVVGPTNGTGDYVGDGGVRFDAYQADAVADAIRRVIDGDRVAYRVNARAAAEERLDVATVIDRLEAILQGSRRQRPATLGRPLAHIA